MSYLTLAAADNLVFLWFASLIIAIAFGLLFFREVRRLKDIAEALHDLARRAHGGDKPGPKE